MGPAVLIADADSDLCGVCHRFLSRHGWQVQTAGSGVECLAQLRQCSPYLLVLDVQLPWGGADGLLAVMRTDRRLGRIPVVLTSANGPIANLVLPPVVQGLRKPFSLTALLDLAHEHLRERIVEVSAGARRTVV
jgi:DNA-binding NtrC family response regulator